MPKENVDCIAGTGLRTEVSWKPGETGYVQVATINQRSTITFDPESEPETVTTSAASPELFYGWHATLDRDGINRMIRALRKARDSVFGRDE